MENIIFDEIQKEKFNQYTRLLKDDIEEIINNGLKIGDKDNVFMYDYTNNEKLFLNIKKNITLDLSFTKNGITIGFTVIGFYHIEENTITVEINEKFLSLRKYIDSQKVIKSRKL